MNRPRIHIDYPLTPEDLVASAELETEATRESHARYENVKAALTGGKQRRIVVYQYGREAAEQLGHREFGS